MVSNKNKKTVWLTLLASFFFIANTAAISAGDIEAGKAKSTTCVACHGADGNTEVDIWPKIAGQHPNYLVEQMLAFKQGPNGPRYEPTMTNAIINFSETDIQDLAAYFASLSHKIGKAKPNLVKLGEQIYRGGNMQTGLIACIACHGPSGDGIASASYPMLSGQNATYTATQLKAYRSGKRTTDPEEIMRTIAAKMTDEEIEAVSSYIAGLHKQ